MNTQFDSDADAVSGRDPDPGDGKHLLARLVSERCSHQSAQARLDETALAPWLSRMPNWKLQTESRAGTTPHLHASYRFANYHETLAFVNALAWRVHEQDHHPDLLVSYDQVTVRWSTHSAGGVTRNDLICAALTDELYAQRAQA